MISYSIYLLWLAKKVSIMSSEFIHVIACVRNSFLFTAELWSIPCIDHILLIHSFINGHKLLPHRFVFFFFNILFWCTLNWMKGLLSKLSRASLLFTRIPDFLSLQSRIPVSCLTSLADLSLFTFLQVGTQPWSEVGASHLWRLGSLFLHYVLDS